MNRATTNDTLQSVLQELDNVKQTSAGEWKARCPAHDDNSPSLSVSEGDSRPVVLHCHAGCDFGEIADELDSLSTSWKPWDGTEAGRYSYCSASGEVLFDVVRYEMRDEEHPACGDKQFMQQAYKPGHDGAGGTDNGCPDGYVWGRKKHGIDPVLYRLPKVAEAGTDGPVVFVVEGEKDVHTLEEWGFTATTNPQGAGEWQPQHTEALEGAHVVILPDNDPQGQEHGRMVAQELLPVAESVRLVALPDVPEKGDVTDWADAGGTAEDLKQLVEDAPEMSPDENGHDKGAQVVFWYIDEDEGKVKIDRSQFIRFLEEHGFGKTYIESDLESRLARVKDSVVRLTSVERIKDFTLRYVREALPEGKGLVLPSHDDQHRTTTDYEPEDVADALLRGANVYFSSGLFEFLSPLDLDFHEDTAESAFFYFENGFVEVTAGGYELRPYSQMDGVIWQDQIIDRPFQDLTDRKPAGWDWHEHLLNVAGRETQRHNALCTALGYLQHGYKDPAVTKAIILMDEKDSEVEEGRTGKSLTAKALQHTCPTLRVDGRNFSFDSRFAFQEVGVDTQIVDFNDVRERFPFERLFSVITDDFPIERKGQDRVTISFEDSPKFLLSTNYVIEGKGASFEDRTHQIEFSDYYGPDHTPKDEFDRRLFDDWGEEEWARFDNVMMACVRQYLRDGLVGYQHVNVNYRRLKQQTCPDFAEWATDFFETGEQYEKEALWRSFREAYSPDYEDLSKSKFGYWLNDFARVYELDKKQRRRRKDGNRKRYVTFRSRE
ncbi:primase-helicase family protein [Salinibacter ruber]|uniref:primase-helicase family protein n=1 Tax=Salinibacter ruber TaxID=146919 RepID=UPI001F084342|nr:primase-helicase family protein [Salinibacter ruber]